MTPASINKNPSDKSETLVKWLYALHPCFLAWFTHDAKVEVDMNPSLASPDVAGLPMTSLERGTPLAAIWKRDDWGQVLDEAVSRPEHVVYSVEPSTM